MATKTICIDCKEYSTVSKRDNCFRCEGGSVLFVNSAFRLPRKSEDKKWSKIKELYYIQCSIPRTEPGRLKYLMGFRNNAGWLPKNFSFPKALKEKAILQIIKESSKARISS